jgi:hypothetical protein
MVHHLQVMIRTNITDRVWWKYACTAYAGITAGWLWRQKDGISGGWAICLNGEQGVWSAGQAQVRITDVVQAQTGIYLPIQEQLIRGWGTVFQGNGDIRPFQLADDNFTVLG